MTKKTFRDMLPLTDEQRERLELSNDCEKCPLSDLNAKWSQFALTCSEFATGKWCECSEARSETLRIDDNYRANNTSEQICKKRVWELLNTDGVQVRLETHIDHYLIVHNVYGCAEQNKKISFVKGGDK